MPTYSFRNWHLMQFMGGSLLGTTGADVLGGELVSNTGAGIVGGNTHPPKLGHGPGGVGMVMGGGSIGVGRLLALAAMTAASRIKHLAHAQPRSNRSSSQNGGRALIAWPSLPWQRPQSRRPG